MGQQWDNHWGKQTPTAVFFTKMHLCSESYSAAWNQSFVGWEAARNFSQTLFFKDKLKGTSLVAQGLRIRLPMQGTRVRALVREDPTCRRATKPVCHNYWACALEPTSHNYWACVPRLLKPARLEPVLRNKRSHCNEKPVYHNEDPTQPKISK